MRRLAALAIGALVAAALQGLPACDEPYRAPCAVVARRVVAEDDAIGSLDAITLTQSANGVVATWQRRETADAGSGPASPPIAFDVVTFNADGAAGRRESIPAPEALRGRRDSVEDIGVVIEDGASLVHWTETTTTTDPDGRVRTAAAIKVAYVVDGVPRTVFSSPGGTCVHCNLRVAFASLGTESIAIVRTEPDVPDVVAPLAIPAAPRFSALRLRRAGGASEEALPWLVPAPVPPAADGGTSSTTSRDIAPTVVVAPGGTVTVQTDGRAWLVDPSLRPVRGPVDLPAPDALVAWDATSEASAAWSVARFDTREIFAGLVPPDVGEVTSRERVSDGRVLLAADRSGEDFGITFDSTNRIFFARIDARGHKQGGDVFLSAIPGSYASGYGKFVPSERYALLASRAGRFTAVTLGSGKLVATEIRCAP